MSITAAEAKQFLIERVVDQATQDAVVLTDAEIRLLDFPESSIHSREKEIAAMFGGKFDYDWYEAKIANLLRRVYEHDIEAGMKRRWDECLDELDEADMYLFVMLEKAGIVKTTTHLALPDWRLFLGLVPIGIAIALAGMIAFSPLAERFIPNSYVRLGICVLLLISPILYRPGRRRRG